MNDSDTKFFANGEGIENIVPYFDNGDILTPEASIHIVKDNEKEQGKNSKNKLEKVQFQWRRSNLVGELCHKLKESASPLEIYEKVVNLEALIELLVTQSNLYSKQNGHHFITNPEEMKAFLGTNYIMAVNQLPHIYLCTGIVTILLATMVFKTFLQRVDTMRSCRIFTLEIILMRPTIGHLNKLFQESYLNEPK